MDSARPGRPPNYVRSWLAVDGVGALGGADFVDDVGHPTWAELNAMRVATVTKSAVIRAVTRRNHPIDLPQVTSGGATDCRFEVGQNLSLGKHEVIATTSFRRLEIRGEAEAIAARRSDGVARKQAGEVDHIQPVVEVLDVGLQAHAPLVLLPEIGSRRCANGQ